MYYLNTNIFSRGLFETPSEELNVISNFANITRNHLYINFNSKLIFQQSKNPYLVISRGASVREFTLSDPSYYQPFQPNYCQILSEHCTSHVGLKENLLVSRISLSEKTVPILVGGQNFLKFEKSKRF